MLILNGQVSIDSLVKVKKQLDAALLIAKSDLEISGTIQRFELTYEVCWKTMRKVLIAIGFTEVNNPRNVFAAAYSKKLIDDLNTWNNYIKLTNLTVHTYDESTAHEVFDAIPAFSMHISTLLKIAFNIPGGTKSPVRLFFIQQR